MYESDENAIFRIVPWSMMM